MLTSHSNDTRTPAFRQTPPGPLREQLARVAALPGAIRLAVRHGPEIWQFLRSGDPGLSVALRDAFGFGEDPDSGPLVPPQIFSDSPVERSSPDQPVVIVIPVFNAADDVRRVLHTLESGIDVDHRILLIDDGSDDPAIAPMLSEFAAKFPDRVLVETFDSNLGFISAVNHGISLAADLGGHVVLLNTDTLPPDGWVSRLIAPILADPHVATVTPVSNTAEIFSIPAKDVHSPLSDGLVTSIDDVAAKLAPDWTTVSIPTGIGFAMAMNRRFLDRLGGFDPIFGRGYGEEVDWCQRARAAGGRHVLAVSVFIGHTGGGSFSSDERDLLLRSSAQTIASRYPYYDREVQDWSKAASHAVQRSVLTVPWLDAVSRQPVPIFIGHVLGGGAEIALRKEVLDTLSAGAPGVVVLRAGGSAPWRVDIEGAGFRQSCRFADTATLLAFLAPIKNRRVVYSCGVGARDVRDVPEILLALTQNCSYSLELRLHDHFAISPSYCLLDSRGRYRGLPNETDVDPAHSIRAMAGRPARPLGDWRRLWAKVIARAAVVTAFSTSSRDLFVSIYPEALKKIVVKPHDLPEEMPPRLPSGGRAIGVLGGINQAKGADILVALARLYRTHEAYRKIAVIGELDPHFRLPKPHFVTGRYQRREISDLAIRHDIGLWLIPSICHETYSFTTREALATGLPVLTFDLGAQAEAARGAGNGHVLTIDSSDITRLAATIEHHFAAA